MAKKRRRKEVRWGEEEAFVEPNDDDLQAIAENEYRLTSLSDKPSWFKLESYNNINKLTQLYCHLALRNQIYNKYLKRIAVAEVGDKYSLELYEHPLYADRKLNTKQISLAQEGSPLAIYDKKIELLGKSNLNSALKWNDAHMAEVYTVEGKAYCRWKYVKEACFQSDNTLKVLNEKEILVEPHLMRQFRFEDIDLIAPPDDDVVSHIECAPYFPDKERIKPNNLTITNFLASKELLLKAFSNYLDTYFKFPGVERYKNKTSLSQLRRYRILPLIDFKLWSLFKHIRIDTNILCEWVDINNKVYTDDVKPMIEDVLSPNPFLLANILAKIQLQNADELS